MAAGGSGRGDRPWLRGPAGRRPGHPGRRPVAGGEGGRPAAAAAARPAIEAGWTGVHARLVARLDQANPPELGAVWAMRSGEICGLVNGRGSFGGLSGMVRFHTQNGEPVFNADHRPGFKEAWARCDRDRWIVLRADSDETGFCPTKLGQARCETVKVWMPK